MTTTLPNSSSAPSNSASAAAPHVAASASTPSPERLPVFASQSKWRLCVRSLAIASVIYLAGVATGSGATFAWLQDHMFTLMRKPHEFEQFLYNSMSSELSLTDEQRAEIQPIFKAHFAEVQKLRVEVHPRFLSIFESLESDIASRLSPEQEKVWHARWKHLREETFPPDPNRTPATELPPTSGS